VVINEKHCTEDLPKRGDLSNIAVAQKQDLEATECYTGLFNNIFEWNGQVPVKGLNPTQLIVLGAVLLYQLVLIYQFEHHRPLGKGIQPLLKAV
jgi:hypothetical protein